MADEQLSKCLNEIVGKFIWLNLDPDSGYGLTSIYGFLGKTIDNRLIKFYPVDHNSIVYTQLFIAIKDINGLCWKGTVLEKHKLEANLKNLKVRSDILREKEAQIASTNILGQDLYATFKQFDNNE